MKKNELLKSFIKVIITRKVVKYMLTTKYIYKYLSKTNIMHYLFYEVP